MVANFEELNDAQTNQQPANSLNPSDLKTLQLISSNKDTLKMDDLVLLLYGHSAFQNLYAGC